MSNSRLGKYNEYIKNLDLMRTMMNFLLRPMSGIIDICLLENKPQERRALAEYSELIMRDFPCEVHVS